jgi:hypothetical protein
VNNSGYVETVYADDLNCFKEFDQTVSDASIISSLKECQADLHRWGAVNQVCFDPGKESFHILDNRHPLGDSFRFLGVAFDTQLVMKDGIMELAAQAHARVQMILRARKFNSERETIQLYKAHVLSFLEHATPAIHHAVPFHLAALDRVQNSFLEALGLSAADALAKHKLAPLRTRRDISLLGFLHRFAHNKAPSCFSDLFRFGEAAALGRRRHPPVHSRQIFDPIDGTQARALERSVYGLIYTFNSLPADIADCSNTSCFQGALQKAVAAASRKATMNEWWPLVLSDGVRQLSLAALHDLFK